MSAALEEVERVGWALLPASALGAGDLAREASASPWVVAERLLGEPAEMVERQPIRAVAGGRSFASSDVFTPLHTDSQPYLGAPPSVQVMICVRPAARGGETLLADGWELVRRATKTDPALARRLFEERRRIPFYFGDVCGPTVARWRGRVAFTHSPAMAAHRPDDDRMAASVQALVEAAPLIELRPAAGDVLVVDNHRMLHGRRAFADPLGAPPREFVRLLVWLARPFAVDAEIAARTTAPSSTSPPSPLDDPSSAHRMAVVMELVRGAPPGLLSAREGITEAELYRWRDAALRAAASALKLRSS